MAAPDKGAAIFTSESFVVEALERRTHLAAAPLSAYYPLVQGSQWVYRIVDDGKRRTDTETISSEMKRMHAQSVYQRVVDSSDGGHEVNYENFSSSGQIQLHGIGDDSLSMVFSPPVAFPKLAKVGQRTVMDGKIDMVEDSVRIRGIYHSEIRVLANEKVQVRAGTFNCVKVQFTIDLSLKFQKHAMHMIDTQTDWMAKGVGSVKWTEKSHTETTDNGRHKVEESLSKSSLSSYSIGVL